MSAFASATGAGSYADLLAHPHFNSEAFIDLSPLKQHMHVDVKQGDFDPLMGVKAGALPKTNPRTMSSKEAFHELDNPAEWFASVHAEKMNESSFVKFHYPAEKALENSHPDSIPPVKHPFGLYDEAFPNFEMKNIHRELEEAYGMTGLNEKETDRKIMFMHAGGPGEPGDRAKEALRRQMEKLERERREREGRGGGGGSGGGRGPGPRGGGAAASSHESSGYHTPPPSRRGPRGRPGEGAGESKEDFIPPPSTPHSKTSSAGRHQAPTPSPIQPIPMDVDSDSSSSSDEDHDRPAAGGGGVNSGTPRERFGSKTSDVSGRSQACGVLESLLSKLPDSAKGDQIRQHPQIQRAWRALQVYIPKRKSSVSSISALRKRVYDIRDELNFMARPTGIGKRDHDFFQGSHRTAAAAARSRKSSKK